MLSVKLKVERETDVAGYAKMLK